MLHAEHVHVFEYTLCFIKNQSLPFLRATAATAVARLSHRNSVRLSHGWISQKQCKLELPNFHRWLPGRH